MTIIEATNKFRDLATNVPHIGYTFKFVFSQPEGVIFVDSTQEPSLVSNEDDLADCELHMTMETFLKLKTGKISPTMALMMGKVKVKGDMSVAMKLQQFM